MIATLAALLAAHFVADFVLQSDAMVARKRHSAVMARHILIVTATTALALGWLDGRILVWIAGTHLAMDMIKTWWLKPTLRAFAADQIFHLGVIAILAMLYPDATTRGVGLFGAFVGHMRGHVYFPHLGGKGDVLSVGRRRDSAQADQNGKFCHAAMVGPKRYNLV